MKPNLLDIVLSLLLFTGVVVYIAIEQQEKPFEILDENGDPIVFQNTAVVLFWSTTSKPSQRGLQVLTRLHKKHPDIQVIGVYSSEEDHDKIKDIQSSLGLQYPLVPSSYFPSSLPLSVVIQGEEKRFVSEDLHYQDILSLLNLEL